MTATEQEFEINDHPLIAIPALVGLDPTTADYELTPGTFPDGENIIPSSNYGGFQTTLGREIAFAQNLPSIPDGACKFRRVFPQNPVHIWSADDGTNTGNANLYYSVYGGTPLPLTLPAGATWHSGSPVFFAFAQGWCFVSNGVDRPLKIDQSLNVTFWGIIAPTTAPNVGASGGGNNLLGTYNYCVTFANGNIQESSQGVISAPITCVGGFQSGVITITGTPGTGDTITVFAPSRFGGFYPLCTYTVPGAITTTQAAIGLAQAINAVAGFANTAAPLSNTVVWSLQYPYSANQIFDFFCSATDAGGSTAVAPTSSTAMTVHSGQQVVLNNIPTSSDPQVNERNIYRIGGSLGQWRLVGTINDNTTTTFTDNLADSAVTGQSLTVFRDPPPNFVTICGHQGRIFGCAPGQSSAVWYSNYNEPWGFNSDTGILYADIEGYGDAPVAMGSLGAICVVVKQGTTYTIWGSTDADFTVYYSFDTGCVAPLSLTVIGGIARWLSAPGVIQFDGQSGPQNLSDGSKGVSNIKAVLDTLTTNNTNPATYAGISSFIHDRQYHLVIPSLQKTFRFDTRTGGWYRMGVFGYAPIVDINNIFGRTPILVDANGAIEQWFASPTDLGNPITAYLTSPLGDGGDLYTTKKATRFRMEAPQMQTGSTAQLTVVANPGAINGNPPPDKYPYPGAQQIFEDNLRTDGSMGGGINVYNSTMPDRMVGYDFQFTLAITTSVPVYIGKMALYGEDIRAGQGVG